MQILPGIYNWTSWPVGTTWSPSAVVAADFTQSELAIYDLSGKLVGWAGTAGRVQPSPAPTLVGSLTLSGAGGQTTLTATFSDSTTKLLSAGLFTYEWDVWDSSGNHSRMLVGSWTATGVAVP